ncbi:hypothetical protein ACFXJ5_21425 [Streptomyces sp. NPDC059373]
MLTLILVVVAGASLISGWLLGVTVLVYVALAASAVGLLVMAGDLWLRRRRAQEEGFEPDDAVGDDAEDDDKDKVAAIAAEGSDTEAQEGEESDVEAADEDVLDGPDPDPDPALSDDSLVLIVAGRKRFHTPGCPSLDGKDYEELTLAEAREESFTPCTLCAGAAVKELAVRQR